MIFFLIKWLHFFILQNNILKAYTLPLHSSSVTFSRQLLILVNWQQKRIVSHKTTSKLDLNSAKEYTRRTDKFVVKNLCPLDGK